MNLPISIAATLLYVIGAFLPAQRARAISWVTAAAWLLHAAALGLELALPGFIRIGFATMLSATLWISVLAYWLENRNSAFEGLRLLVLPCAALATVLPDLFPGPMFSTQSTSLLFAGHIAIALLAYSILTLAAFHAVLMAFQEFRLHARSSSRRYAWLDSSLDKLPALLTMEKLLFRLVRWGFVLLTLAVFSGGVFSEELFGIAFQLTHKVIFTILSWFLFGALLAGRHWLGWRGKTALRFTLAGFLALLLAYVGSRFVLEVVLHRGAV